MSDSALDPPAGFGPLFRTSPYLDLIGPLHGRGDGADLVVGLRIAEKHCNARGTAHGGVLCALADIAMGYATAPSLGADRTLVTASLTTDFVGAARMGDWLQVRVEFSRAGSRLAFVNAYAEVGERVVFRANATFAVVERG